MDYGQDSGGWTPDNNVGYGPASQAGQAPYAGDAWLSSVLGTAIGVYVDRTLNNPQTLSNNTGYGMGSNGQLYQIGKPVGQVNANVTPTGAGVSPLMLLLVVGAVLMASHH